jgi:hypothetical protein
MSGGKTVGIILIATSLSYRQAHACVDGSDMIYNVGFATYDFGGRGEDWIDRDLLTIPQDRIASVTVGDVTLERKDGQFTVAGLANHEEVAENQVNRFIRAISQPTFDSIQGKGEDELAKLNAPDIQITVKCSALTNTRKKQVAPTYSPHQRTTTCFGSPRPISSPSLSYGRGFRALVSARFIPISVSGEGRLVRRLPESGSRNARWVIRRDADVGSTASVGSLAKSYFDCPDADRVKPLAGSHQAIASCESRHRN